MTHDPWIRAPALYPVAYIDAAETRGVLSRRVFAYLLDILFVTLITSVMAIVILVLAIASFGLLHILWAVLPFTALIYATLTIGGMQSATWGMRLCGLHYRRADGTRPDYLHALIATGLFYATVAVTSGIILLLPLFTQGHRTLHDMIAGLVLVRSDYR